MRQNDMDEYERNNRMSDRMSTSNLEMMIWKEGSSVFTFCSFCNTGSDPPEAWTDRNRNFLGFDVCLQLLHFEKLQGRPRWWHEADAQKRDL